MADVFSAPTSVLHIAPEPAIERRLRGLRDVRYTSGDISGRGVDMRIDVCEIPFADGQFDIVICNHVLEHVLEDKTAMKEINRVLKPGGRAIVIVPIDCNRKSTFEDSEITDPQERLLYFGQRDHVRIYGLDYFDRLRHAGFHVERWKASCLQEFALLPDEEVIMATRSPMEGQGLRESVEAG
jgi:SAM-dependent methyltransferase